MEDKTLFSEVALLTYPSQQAITFSKLVTEAQDQGVKTVQT